MKIMPSTKIFIISFILMIIGLFKESDGFIKFGGLTILLGMFALLYED